MVFHWSVSDNKSPRVSKTLFLILADLNNAVVWISLLLLLLFTPLEFFTSVLADGFSLTASLLKSPGLVSGLWSFLAMLSFG